MASKIKIRFFSILTDTTSKRLGAGDKLQRILENWIKKNGEIQIIDASTSLSDDFTLLTIKYYESFSRDLILEKENKELV